MNPYVSMVLTAFAGGVVTWGSTHLGDGVPTTSAQWKAALAGALVAGVAAVVHRFQPVPGAKS